MAHYAFIEDGIVVDVITGRDEDDLIEGVTSWADYYSANRQGLMCLQTSYNTRGGVHYDFETGEPSDDQSKALRKNYAGVGFAYDSDRDGFIPPKPFESWVLNDESCLWEPPLPYPSDGKEYSWDEVSVSWVEIPEV